MPTDKFQISSFCSTSVQDFVLSPFLGQFLCLTVVQLPMEGHSSTRAAHVIGKDILHSRAHHREVLSLINAVMPSKLFLIFETRSEQLNETMAIDHDSFAVFLIPV